MIAQHQMVLGRRRGWGDMRVWGLLDSRHKISCLEPLSRFDPSQ